MLLIKVSINGHLLDFSPLFIIIIIIIILIIIIIIQIKAISNCQKIGQDRVALCLKTKGFLIK